MTDKTPQMPDEIWYGRDGNKLASGNFDSNGNHNGAVRYVRSDLCAPTDKDEALRAFNRIKNQVNPYGGYIFGKSIYQWQADLEILEEFINGK